MSVLFPATAQAPTTVPDLEWAWNNTQLLNEYMNKACGESGGVFEAEESACILAQVQERAQGAHGPEGRVGNQGKSDGR